MYKKSPETIVEQAYEDIVFSIKSAEEGYCELLDSDIAEILHDRLMNMIDEVRADMNYALADVENYMSEHGE
jgi:hypothetical protein